jgi:hypothetical protein
LHGRISNYIRRNAIGCVALFFALGGGAAWATHPGGANTISSGDIINDEVRNRDIANNAIGTNKIVTGGVRSGDLLDESVTGADIDEASLSPACPEGYTLAAKDVCFSAQQGGNLATALETCAASGDRVPTIPEAWLVLAALPNPPAGQRIITWTSNEFEDTDGSGPATPDAIDMSKDSTGVINRGDVDQNTVIPYRCVTSARG